jgi:hypothetical protein
LLLVVEIGYLEISAVSVSGVSVSGVSGVCGVSVVSVNWSPVTVSSVVLSGGLGLSLSFTLANEVVSAIGGIGVSTIGTISTISGGVWVGVVGVSVGKGSVGVGGGDGGNGGSDGDVGSGNGGDSWGSNGSVSWGGDGVGSVSWGGVCVGGITVVVWAGGVVVRWVSLSGGLWLGLGLACQCSGCHRRKRMGIRRIRNGHIQDRIHRIQRIPNRCIPNRCIPNRNHIQLRRGVRGQHRPQAQP